MKKILSLICFLAVAWLCNAAYAGTVEDVLTSSMFPATSSNSYVAFSDIKGPSGAVYAGKTATNYNSIQINNTPTNCIVTTASGGKVRKVVVVWNSNTSTSTARYLYAYGKNAPYTATDLSNTNTSGTQLFMELYSGQASSELTIDGDYKYIGFRGSGGAQYIESITITWENATALSAPKFSVEGGTYDEAQSVMFTGIDEGATVRYTTDAEVDLKGETGFEVWDGVTPIAVTRTQTLRAIATSNGNFSEETRATYTMKTAAPVIAANVDENGNFFTETLDVTVSSKYADFGNLAIECKVTKEDGTTEDVKVTSNPFTFRIAGTATVTATALYKADGLDLEVSDEATATFTYCDPNAMKGIFARVSSTGAISAGDEVIIVAEKAGKVMSVANSSSKRTGVNEAVNGVCRLGAESEACVFTLETGDYAYRLHDVVNSNYVSMTTAENTDINVSVADVSILFQDKYVKIQASNAATRMLLWHSNDVNVFGKYLNKNFSETDANNDYANVELYRKLRGASVEAAIEICGGTSALVSNAQYEWASRVVLTGDGASEYSVVFGDNVTSGTFENTAAIDVSEAGAYTIATPNALYRFEVVKPAVSTNAELLSMEAGRLYQVNVNLEGIKQYNGVLYARTTEQSAAPSMPTAEHIANGFDRYEDGDYMDFVQRDWVAIESSTLGENIALKPGFVARYTGETLVPVTAIEQNGEAASSELNVYTVANVFYGSYNNMDETFFDRQGSTYKPFFVQAKVNEVAKYEGGISDDGYLYTGSAVGTLNGKGVKLDGMIPAASAKSKQFEGVLVKDAEANGGVKLIVLSEATDATVVEALKADGKAAIYGTEGAVVVAGADGKVTIFDAMGRMVKSVSAEGAATVEMPAGYYIVRTAGTAKAVIVK